MMRIFGGGSGDVEQFRRLLDEQNDWPSHFTFKFIVPLKQFGELQGLLGDHEFKTRSSSKGNYVSVTLSPLMDSAESIIQLYRKVSVVEGIVSL